MSNIDRNEMLSVPNIIKELQRFPTQVTDLKARQEIPRDRFIDYGFPIFNDATEGLDRGVVLIAGPPNLGKSIVVESLDHNVLAFNDNVALLDFTLDDSVDDRITKAIARIARIPINWSKMPFKSDVTNAARESRDRAYEKWTELTTTRGNSLRIIDQTNFDNTGRCLSTICSVVRAVREKQPDKKLVISIDGFHNVVVDDLRSSDENYRNAHLSSTLDNLAAETHSVILATAHTPKGSARRGLDSSAVKGSGQMGYDARIIATIFSDLKVNRGKRQVYHQCDLPHLAPPNNIKELPVIELDIVKSKASSFSNVIFYPAWPEYAYMEEGTLTRQKEWADMILGKS